MTIETCFFFPTVQFCKRSLRRESSVLHSVLIEMCPCSEELWIYKHVSL